MREVRAIIAGGRDFTDGTLLERTADKILNPLAKEYKITIVSGKAKGADTKGEQYGRKRGYHIAEYPADWNTHGKRAGYLRNKEMAVFASADDAYGILIAFWDGVSRGTKLMIDLAKEYGLEIHVVNY